MCDAIARGHNICIFFFSLSYLSFFFSSRNFIPLMQNSRCGYRKRSLDICRNRKKLSDELFLRAGDVFFFRGGGRGRWFFRPERYSLFAYARSDLNVTQLRCPGNRERTRVNGVTPMFARDRVSWNDWHQKADVATDPYIYSVLSRQQHN